MSRRRRDGCKLEAEPSRADGPLIGVGDVLAVVCWLLLTLAGVGAAQALESCALHGVDAYMSK